MNTNRIMKINLFRISIVIFIIITIGCKKDKVTEPFHKDIYKYSYEPILKVLNKQLLVFLDSVILDKQKCSTYREKIVFNLQSVNNYEVDINTKTDTIINYFRISQAFHISGDYLMRR